MTVFFFTLAVMGLVVLAMSIGVLFGRKPISGTCGGMGALGIDKGCDICGGDPIRCEESAERRNIPVRSDLGLDIMADPNTAKPKRR